MEEYRQTEEYSDKWTDNEVHSLLSIYSTREIRRDFDSSKRIVKIFSSIASQLATLGIHHTEKQCREKIKKLKQDYKKIKDHNNKSGSDRKTSKWYDTLDAILGHRPAYAGNTGTPDSAVGLLEAIDSDTGSCSPPVETPAEVTALESSMLADASLPSDTPTACSTPRRPSSTACSPPPATPGKRKRGDSTVMCLVKDMLESEEDGRRESHVQLQGLVEMLKEQTGREEYSDKWTDNEVQALLRIYSTGEIQRVSDSSKRNIKIFPSIASQLATLGIHHTAKQCREKIKKLKQDYKKIKDHNNKSGSDRKRSKWYDTLDAILGHRPAYAGNTGTPDSAVGLLEAIDSDTGSCSPPVETHAEVTAPESSMLAEASLPNHTPTACSTPRRPSSTACSPPPATPGKRRRGDSTVMCLVKDMLESEEDGRRESHAQLQGLVEMLKEQTGREEYSDKWTDNEVKALLRIYSMGEIQRVSDSSKIFSSIASQLATLGIHHTAKQCREKIKKLKQDYKKIKDHNNKSGSDRKTSKWYDTLDAILGHRPAYAGNTGTPDSAVGLLEAIDSDTGSCSPPVETPAEVTALESSMLAEVSLPSNTPTACSTPRRPSSTACSPPPATPGKRRRDDSTVMCLVKDMLESEEDSRRESHAQIQGLVEMLKEQTVREAEEYARLRAEAAEARRQQASFQEGLLTLLDRLVSGAQGPSRPAP